MTTRELYNATIKTLYEYGTDEAVDLMNEFKTALDNLDARNEKRKSADSKAKQATQARRDAVLHFLRENEGVFVRDDIAAATGLTAGQVSAACKALLTDEVIVKSEVKVEKSRKVGYSAA